MSEPRAEYEGLYNLLHALPVGTRLDRYTEEGIPGEWHILNWPGESDQWWRHNGDTPAEALSAFLGPMNPDPRDEATARMLDRVERGCNLAHIKPDVWWRTAFGWGRWERRVGKTPEEVLL